jgi:hypothetical protein
MVLSKLITQVRSHLTRSVGRRLTEAVEAELWHRAPVAALDRTRRGLVQDVVAEAARGFERNPIAVFIVDVRDGLHRALTDAADALLRSPTPGAPQASRRLRFLANQVQGDTFVQHLINLCLDAAGVYNESVPVERIDGARVIAPLVTLLSRVPTWNRDLPDARTAITDPEFALRHVAIERSLTGQR